MIKLEQVSAGYGKTICIEDVSLQFPEGKMTVIAGPNGSGKSTLVKSLVGLSQVHSGQITVQGQPLQEIDGRKLARMVSYLPQNRNLPAITAWKMVLHGRFPHLSYPRHYSQQDHEMVREAMEQLGIWELRKKEVARLSGGERQKVYLAMALAGDTGALILDEPTTYLDICHQLEFLKLLEQLKDRGKTIIVILHDLNAALQCADQMVVMNCGRAAGVGRPEEIFESRILEQVFGIRSHVFTQENGDPFYYFTN